MTVNELYKYLNERIPASLSCDWDNDGLMCCPNGGREVKKILVTLDISVEMVDYAVKNECDVILSHHPLVFRPLKSLAGDSGVSKKLIKLVQNGISAMSFHTRLDALCGGVNDVLAERLGLDEVEQFGCDGITMGRIGSVRPTTLEEFAKFVKNKLNAPCVFYNGDLAVHKVAVVGGNGEDFIGEAKKCGADTFVSGRIGYHVMADTKENGINLVEAGHYFTEVPVLEKLAETVRCADARVEVVFGDSNNVKMI